jgi:Cof subfamily protein (haloacid dehalogenase superfamily)
VAANLATARKRLAATRVTAYSLVATDLDGTLLRSDGSVSARTRRTLGTVGAMGCRVVVVTARAPLWLRDVLLDLDLGSAYAICSNGAVVQDFERGEPLLHHPLSAEVAVRLVRALREAAPGVAFACERESITIREPGYVPLWPTPGMTESGDAELFASEPVSKLIVQHPHLSQDDLYQLARGICGVDATATISGQMLVEISAAGVTKAFALAALCEQLTVESRAVIAFGDMPNDIPMLEWAGYGIAVANAHPDVIGVADEVTRSNDEDGVAVALERLVLNQPL